VSAVAALDQRQSTVFSRLRGLLEVTRLVRTGEDLPALLGAIARTISDSLAFRTVVINLYRPEWDDYVVSTVYGSDDARDALLGQVRQVADWEPLLDQRFLQRGAYLVPAGEFDWEGHIGSYTPDIPISDDPNSWHPDDALFAPMRAADGRLLGILSVDEPISGRKPSGDEIDVLVAVSEHAALAVQATQEASRAKANREALAHLLAVSAKLNESTDTSELLHHVCDAISEALGFEKVAVQLLNRERGTYESVAEAGFDEGENLGVPLTVEQADKLLASELVEECLLLSGDDAKKILPERENGYRSKLNGRGPRSWQNHWLFVPLFDRRGGRIGYIWADDPVDRLQPEPERLRILRAFANQTMTALEQAAQFEAIQNSHAHQRALIDASPVAIIDFDFEGRVRSWNAGAAEIFGWSPEEVIGRVSPIVPDDDLELFLSNLQRIRDTGEVLRDLDFKREHRDGTLIDISTSAGPIRNGAGEIVGCIALMMDVTSRKRSERALAASEARKDAILRAALDCVVIVDHDGLVAELNPATEETFGWTRSEAIGRNFLELVVVPEHRGELSGVFETGTGPLLGARLEINALRSDQRAFPCEIAITRVDVPGPALFAVSLRDVTKRHQREERMREAEAKYRTLVEQLPIATYINDIGLPLRTRYMSPQIETMLGYPVSDWLQGDQSFFVSRLHPDDRERVIAETQRTHETGEDFRLEYRLIAADGRVVWVRDQTVAVRDEEYRPLFLQGYLVDVTDRRAADEALRRSEEIYRHVVEGSRDLIAVVAGDGTTSYISPAVEALLGYEPHELVGREFGGIVHPEDVSTVRSFFESRAAGLDVIGGMSARVRHKDGSWVTLEGTVSVLESVGDEAPQFVCVARPVRRPALAAAG
jgi:PAS domain S-box-containing protein